MLFLLKVRVFIFFYIFLYSFIILSAGADLHATLDEIDISTLGASALPESAAVDVETDVNSRTKSA